VLGADEIGIADDQQGGRLDRLYGLSWHILNLLIHLRLFGEQRGEIFRIQYLPSPFLSLYYSARQLWYSIFLLLCFFFALRAKKKHSLIGTFFHETHSDDSGFRTSRRKPLSSACSCLGSLFRTVLWGCIRLKRAEKCAGGGGYLVNGGKECRFIGFRWRVKAAHLSSELQCGCTNLILGYRRFKIEERLDVSTHSSDS
jgi:hypothetical protein